MMPMYRSQFLNSKKFIGDSTVIEMESREQLKDLLANFKKYSD